MSSKVQQRLSIGKEFGMFFVFKCFLYRLLSFKKYDRYMFNFLKDYFNPIIQQYKNYNFTKSNECKKYIWTLWWQGEEDMPTIIKHCIMSQKKYLENENLKLQLINKNNIFDFIDIPDFILEKVNNGKITLTHFSDILRAALISKYGGIRIDATVLCLKKVDLSEFKKIFTVKIKNNSEFLSTERWTGFFIGDNKNSFLFSFIYDCFKFYWNKQNTLIAYLLIDYLIAIAYDQFPSIAKEFDDIPVDNTEIFACLYLLNEVFNENTWNNIVKKTNFLKLTYKPQFIGGNLLKYKNKKKTYWGFISEELSDE